MDDKVFYKRFTFAFSIIIFWIVFFLSGIRSHEHIRGGVYYELFDTVSCGFFAIFSFLGIWIFYFIFIKINFRNKK